MIFKNLGNKIRIIAKVTRVIEMIAYVIMTIVLMTENEGMWPLLFPGVIVVFGVLWVLTVFVLGYAEMVEAGENFNSDYGGNSKTGYRYSGNTYTPSSTPVYTSNPAPSYNSNPAPAHAPAGHGAECSNCRAMNSVNSKFCYKCGNRIGSDWN